MNKVDDKIKKLYEEVKKWYDFTMNCVGDSLIVEIGEDEKFEAENEADILIQYLETLKESNLDSQLWTVEEIEFIEILKYKRHVNYLNLEMWDNLFKNLYRKTNEGSIYLGFYTSILIRYNFEEDVFNVTLLNDNDYSLLNSFDEFIELIDYLKNNDFRKYGIEYYDYSIKE